MDAFFSSAALPLGCLFSIVSKRVVSLRRRFDATESGSFDPRSQGNDASSRLQTGTQSTRDGVSVDRMPDCQWIHPRTESTVLSIRERVSGSRIVRRHL